jgi:hypothetical protein
MQLSSFGRSTINPPVRSRCTLRRALRVIAAANWRFSCPAYLRGRFGLPHGLRIGDGRFLLIWRT